MTQGGTDAGAQALVGTLEPADPPRGRMPRIRLTSARDIRRELAALYRHARHGQLDAARACRLAFLLNSLLHAIEMTDIEHRLRALEQRGVDP